MTDQPRVLLAVKNKIAYVTLNRPDKHNGLDYQMFVELVQAAKTIRKNRSVRCVIMKGEGPSFCAGLDFVAVSKKPSMIPKFFSKLPWRKDNMFQRVAHIWRDLPIPVLAVVHGNCFGGGMQIILACDYRGWHRQSPTLPVCVYGLPPLLQGLFLQCVTGTGLRPYIRPFTKGVIYFPGLDEICAHCPQQHHGFQNLRTLQVFNAPV